MNILFVSNLYPPNMVGGYERLCFDVAREFGSRGHGVSVLTSTFGGLVSRHSGQTVHQALQLLVGKTVYDPYPGTPAQRQAVNRRNISAALQVIQIERPDAVFCWNLFGLDASLLDKLMQLATPITVLLTDVWLLNMCRQAFIEVFFRDHVHHSARQTMAGDPLTHVERAADAVILPCAAVYGSRYMSDLYEKGGLFFSQSSVVHNGVRQAVPTNAAIRQRATPLQGCLRLLFAGRIVDIKGAHHAVEALPRLQSLVGPDMVCSLTIVGDVQSGDYKRRLHELANRLNCAEQVRFLPAVAEAELFGLFQEYDVYVFPSLYEPFALTLIHALAAGIPTVASRVGGNIEIITDHQSGLLYESNDIDGLANAIAQLAQDGGLRGRISAGGREVAAQFTFERMVDGLEARVCSSVRQPSRKSMPIPVQMPPNGAKP